MCNPVFVMNFAKMAVEEQGKSQARKQIRRNYAIETSYEQVRTEDEKIANAVESDNIARSVQEGMSTEATTVSGRGLEGSSAAMLLIGQWQQSRNKLLGAQAEKVAQQGRARGMRTSARQVKFKNMMEQYQQAGLMDIAMVAGTSMLQTEIFDVGYGASSFEGIGDAFSDFGEWAAGLVS